MTEASPPAPGRNPAPPMPVTLDTCVRRLGTKGFATTASLAEALLASPDDVQPLLDQLLVDGLAASVAGAYRLTDAGSERAGELVALDRDAWGTAAAATALDAFLDLDGRMKQIVTDWQLRPGDGEPQVNDHSDPAYDGEVLDRLAALHAEAAVVAGAGRVGLGAAPRLPGAPRPGGRAGDRGRRQVRRVAARRQLPRRWFELHEDLILLAGRTRAEEVEAGRA